MNTLTRNVLVGYGAFCAVNWALTYYAARSGSPLLFGSAGLLSLNESLRPLNLLSHVVDPLGVAQRAGASGPAGGAVAGSAAAFAVPQTFLPDRTTQTVFPTGTTTTF